MLSKITSQFQFPINKRPFTPPLSDQTAPSFHPGTLTQDTVTLSRTSKPRFGATISNEDKQRAMEAARTGDIATLQVLHERYNGSIELVQMKDDAGQTILHHASKNRHRNILEALFYSYGNNRASNIRDTVRDTGRRLMNSENIAIRLGVLTPPVILPLTATLLGSQASLYFNPILNIDEKDNKGRTALCLAAKDGNGPVVEFLLEKGADPNCADNKNRGPRDWAIQNGYYQVSRQIREAQITKIENTRVRKVKEPLLQLCALQDQKEKMLRTIKQQSEKLEKQKKFTVKSKKKKATQNRTVQRKMLQLQTASAAQVRQERQLQQALQREQTRTHHLRAQVNQMGQVDGQRLNMMRNLNAQFVAQQNQLQNTQNQLTHEQFLSQHLNNTLNNTQQQLTVQQAQNQQQANTITQQAGKLRNKRQFIAKLRRTRVKHNRNTQRKIQQLKDKSNTAISNLLTQTFTTRHVRQSLHQMTHRLYDEQHRNWQKGKQIDKLTNNLTNAQQQTVHDQRQIAQLNSQIGTQQTQKQRYENNFNTAISNLLTQTFTTRKVRQDLRDAQNQLIGVQNINQQKDTQIQALTNNLAQSQQLQDAQTVKYKNLKKAFLKTLKTNNTPIPESISPLSSDDESSDDYMTPKSNRSVSPNPEASTSARNQNASNGEQSTGEVHSENTNTTQGSKKRERFIVRGRKYKVRRKQRRNLTRTNPTSPFVIRNTNHGQELETVNPARGNSYSPAEISAAVVESLQNMIPGWLRNPSPSRSRTPSPPPQITNTAHDDRALMNSLLEHYEHYSQRLRESISFLQEQIGRQRNQHTQSLHRTVTDYQELLQDIQNQRDQLRTQRDNQALNFQAQSSSQQLQFQQHLDQVRAGYQQQLDTLHARYQELTTRLVENEETRSRSSNRSEPGGRSPSQEFASRVAARLVPELLPVFQQFNRLQQQRNQQQRRDNRKSWIPRILRGNNNT